MNYLIDTHAFVWWIENLILLTHHPIIAHYPVQATWQKDNERQRTASTPSVGITVKLRDSHRHRGDLGVLAQRRQEQVTVGQRVGLGLPLKAQA